MAVRDMQTWMKAVRADIASIRRSLVRLSPLPNRLTGTGQRVTDLNEAKDAGFYHFGTGAANAPIATGIGSVIVYTGGAGGGARRQEARRLLTDGTTRDLRVWSRDSLDAGATWNAWVLET